MLRAAVSDDVPERGADYGAHVWARLEPRLPADARHRSRWADARPWLAAAAAVLLAVSAFVIGRWSGAPLEPTRGSGAVHEVSTDPRSVRERVVLAAVGDHFERAERALVELAHTTDEGTVDIGAEQAWARQLLDANRLYRQSLQDASSPVLSDLLGELEPILLELVNSPSPALGARASRAAGAHRRTKPRIQAARHRRADACATAHAVSQRRTHIMIAELTLILALAGAAHGSALIPDSTDEAQSQEGTLYAAAPQRSTSATGRPPRPPSSRQPRSRASVRTPLSTGGRTRSTRAAAGRTPCKPSPRSDRPTPAAAG